MNRRNCRFEIKQINEDGTFEGYASIFGTPDGGKDIVDHGAFAETLKHWATKGKPIPLCNAHDLRDCIGGVYPQDAVEDSRGLRIKGFYLLELASAKEAYIRAKNNLQTGLSFGFDAKRKEYKDGYRHLKELVLYEFSPVLFPMHEDAGMTSVKGGDAPGEGDKPYGDEVYADPGYQSDSKKRYPLTLNGKPSEARIRAAWNYINKKKNAGKYDAADLGKVRAKIIAAWKKTIDKDGPPSADDTGKAADAAEAIVALLSLPSVKIVMSDFLAEEQAEQDERQEWWQLQEAFSGALRATIEDDSVDDAQKLSDITASLEEYRSAVLAWAKDAITRDVQGGGDGGAEPSGMMGAPALSETKEGRVLSANNVKKVKAAIDALQALLASAEKSNPGAGEHGEDMDAKSLSMDDEAPAELVTALANLQRGLD